MSVPLNIKPGDRFPEFTLRAQLPDGRIEEVELPLRDQACVLFFYPEADTPGWTAEAISFSEVLDDFEQLNAVVYGASKDPLKEQRKFIGKHRLRTPLLSDNSGRLRALLGNPDSEDPAARITYVIDPGGVVRDVIGVPRIAAEQHPQAALDSLKRTAGS